MIVKLRWSTPVVRRDQDGGHCSESRVQRFPFFRFHVFSFTFSRARVFRFHLGPRSASNERNGESLALVLLLLHSLREAEEEEREPNFFSRALSRPREGRIHRFSSFRACILVSLWRIGFGRDSGNGKLEDLVRLALKRLNVSYLTILSRLVWFERETLVCHERGCEEDICDFHWMTESYLNAGNTCASFSSTISFIYNFEEGRLI